MFAIDRLLERPPSARTFPARLVLQTVVTVACLLACVPALAATPQSTVTVSGSGTISRDPDRAMLSVSIVTNDNVASTATSSNNRLYNALVERMRGAGIAAGAVKTSSYDLNFVPKPPAGDNYKPPQTGYIVTRGISITIDNLSNVGGVIDAAVAAGVTQVNGVGYGLRDERGAHAAAIAQAAHVHLGAIRRISSVQSPPVFAARAVTLAVRAPAQVPTEITPSAIEVHATVTVTYDLTP